MLVRSAAISRCGQYRYELVRAWDLTLPPAVFLMLNPSTANAEDDDPTIRKCLGFAGRWNRGRITVVNLFALRSTDPRSLTKHPAPRGPDNWKWIKSASDRCLLYNVPLVLAWGGSVPRALRPQIHNILHSIDSKVHLRCLGTTKSGDPRHPLMLPYATQLMPWNPNG